MVRRWAVYRVAEEHFVQVGAAPSQGVAAAEALRLASATGATHHVVEQIISRRAAIEQQTRPQVMRRF
jgi:3-hydroxyisobutyrate dehydrogenase-like beta-hydroxyacid dehydrogenase